jgi:uncharacterized RDD family membrane protein YckC
MSGGAAGLPSPGPVDLATPSLRRRMAAFVYEGVLLFGVLFVSGYLWTALTRQRHAMEGQTGLQAFVFVVLALYFVVFWTRGGQTVAMRAWQIRLVTAEGAPVGRLRALLRYLASWLWFVPALLSARVARLPSALEIFVLLGIGIVTWALLSLLHPQRQFWHDALCGTRLVSWRGGPRPRSAA